VCPSSIPLRLTAPLSLFAILMDVLPIDFVDLEDSAPFPPESLRHADFPPPSTTLFNGATSLFGSGLMIGMMFCSAVSMF